MSLPTAQKDISTHPAKGSVVDPVNKAAKDADVDRKIRLYGVIEAFRQGRLPSNAQIDETLQYALSHSPVTVDKLSPDGKKLIQDTQYIIETARQMVQEKNADELLQNFIWHTRDTGDAFADRDLKGGLKDASPVDQDKAREDGQEAVRHLRTLFSLILTNSEVRKLLTDFSLIGRDLLARGLSKGAEAVAPPADRLQGVDESAPNDQFITEGGRVAGRNETPILEARVPGTDKTVRQHPKEDEGTLRNADGSERPLGDVAQEGRERYDAATTQAMQEGQVRKEQAKARAYDEATDLRDAEDPQEEAEIKKKGLRSRIRDMRDNLNDRIPDQHKDRLNDQAERTKRFFSEEYFPEERRDQFLFRGKKVILECQKHDDYQASIRWLLSFIEEYAAHVRTASSTATDTTAKPVASHPALTTSLNELRTLLERFANGQSMDVFIDSVNVLIDDTRRDEGLRTWFKELDAYSRKVLLEPGYVLEPDCNTQARRLRDSGRQFYDEKYKSHFDNLFDSLGVWFRALGDDPLNKRFGEDWARLTKDLLFDDEGNLKFKPDLWNDIRKVILPQLIEKVGYIPIPRIEYTDDALDLVVENLTLSGRNLFPNIVSLDAHNYVKFSPYDAIKDDNHFKMTIGLEQMQADMRDVAFYYRKKTGIPKMSDSGLADVLLGGEGLSATVTLGSATRDPSSVFKVVDVQVKVDTLKFSIRDSKHDFLYKTLRPLATGLIKKQIQKAIHDGLTTALQYVDGQLVGVRDRMKAAKVNEGESRTQVLKELFENKKEEASIKASKASDKAAERNSQFKIVSDKRQSLLQNTGHPAGWVNKTTEKQEAASQGKEWRSDAFTIVDPSKAKSTSTHHVAAAQHAPGSHAPTTTVGTHGAAAHTSNTAPTIPAPTAA
ncbi:hypothetical protein BDQ12DRAFT_307288 [Crucibulum laeve]|uniref:Uncharacterized protein n=1 Tax=Crucibulum laeve TaxID=68775 RepID=A0A5C3M3V4_9AGAR|nr:hypothetical protein BDQ12DRAFT_307288 [Crucibulum laeve]